MIHLNSVREHSRPWGLELMMLFSDDEGNQFMRSPSVPEGSTQSRKDEEAELQKVFIQREIDETKAIKPNYKLSALATAANAILKKSKKLTPAVISMLDQLESGVKAASKANLPDGESATLIVQEILEQKEVQENANLKKAVEQSLKDIVTMTGGVL